MSRPHLAGPPGRVALLALLVSIPLPAPARPDEPSPGDAAAPDPGPRAGDAPNIVLILVDDLGWADLPAYGNEFAETPHIDRLAREGLRFTDFYATAPVCSPTRASIFGGQHPARIGMTDFVPGHWRPFERLVVPEVTGHLPGDLATPADALAERGYRSGYFGKWHLGGGPNHPLRRGWDTAVVTSGRHFAPRFRTRPRRDVPDGAYLADWLTDRAVGFIRANAGGPFFLTVSHFAVHIPLEAKPEDIARFESKPRPERWMHPVYAAMLAAVDESTGRILEALEEAGVAGDTLVILTSDNGGLHRIFTGGGDRATSNAPLRGEKGTLYEGGIRVPCIVRWPARVEAGGVCETPAGTLDLLPTIASAGGGYESIPQILDGASLLPLFDDPGAELDRDALYFHYPHYHHDRPAGAVRSGRWKLIERFDDRSLELYDLAEDIGETNDLSDERPELAARLQLRLATWRQTVDARMPRPNPRHDPERAGEWWSRRREEPLDVEALERHYETRQASPSRDGDGTGSEK